MRFVISVYLNTFFVLNIQSSQMIYKIVLIFVITVLFQDAHVEGAKILGVFSPPFPSHYFLGHILMKNLALRGHNVTIISSYSHKKPINNYREIIISETKKETEEFKQNLVDQEKISYLEHLHQSIEYINWLSEETLSDPNVQDLLKSDEKFDLVIVNSALNDAFAGFAHHFNCPLIVFNTIRSNTWINQYVKIPTPSSYVPDIITGFTDKMSFFERMQNMLVSNAMQLITALYYFPKQNEMLQKFFPGAPYLEDVIKQRTSLVLINSHSSFNNPKPTVPNAIEIGGFHVEDTKELPKDLKNYLDEAKQGVVLFSLGSNINITNISLEKRRIIMKIFENLPLKVICKFEADPERKTPKNVRIEKWLPQNDILAHQNVKFFITHGGLLSTIEAIYHGVPIIGIPVFGDQKLNMAHSVNLGIGQYIDFNTMTYENLNSTVHEVITNKIYTEKVRERSKIMRDQPLRPIDNAVFWVEYALRYRYANHLKTAAINLSWYQIDNLDVIVVLCTILCFTMFVVYCLFEKLCCSLKSKKSNDNKKKQ